MSVSQMCVDLFVYLPTAVNIVEVEELLSREVGVILERKSKYKIGEAGVRFSFLLLLLLPHTMWSCSLQTAISWSCERGRWTLTRARREDAIMSWYKGNSGLDLSPPQVRLKLLLTMYCLKVSPVDNPFPHLTRHPP